MLLFNKEISQKWQIVFYFNTSNVTIQRNIFFSQLPCYNDFNTSNVTIQQLNKLITYILMNISIHLMLLFNN